MRAAKFLNPNAKISDYHPFWFWACLICLLVAVTIAIGPFVPEGFFEGGVRHSYQALRPRLTDVLVSAIFMGFLYVRGCLRMPNAPIVWLLIIGDVLLFGSFFQMTLSSEKVNLFTIPNPFDFFRGVDISVTPRKLACFIFLLTLFGARAFAGIGIGLLLVVTMVNMMVVDKTFGLYGVVYIIAAFLAVMLQFKVPGMRVNKKLMALFAEDFGRGALDIASEAKRDMIATGDAVKAGVKMVSGAAVAVATGGASIAVSASKPMLSGPKSESNPNDCQ